jgi:hypothetical protein
MKKTSFVTLLLASHLFANPMPAPSFEGNQKIGVQNSILTQVNGSAISIMDVKKKLDLAFHQSYPHLAESTAARFQFYQGSWRRAFLEMVDNELILADAEDKEIKVTEGEVREEMENRFGPNVMSTLDKVGVSYDEAWKMVKNEMIVQRMAWYYINSKALQNVTPQDLRQAYHFYLKENPSYQEWTYRVISIRHENLQMIKPIAEEVHQFLVENKQSPESIGLQLKEIEIANANCTIQVSPEYTTKDLELSTAHRAALAALAPGEYGEPNIQTSRIEKKTIARIFYLSQKEDHPALSFEQMAQKLKQDLLQKAVASEGDRYLGKLRKHYGYDANHLKESVPDTLNPFSIQ